MQLSLRLLDQAPQHRGEWRLPAATMLRGRCDLHCATAFAIGRLCAVSGMRSMELTERTFVTIP